MRRIGRWAGREPWMALNATVATACVITVLSIRWLMMLGVIRVFAIAEDTPNSIVVHHGQLGFGSVPSPQLTHLDHATWKLGFACGIFWVLRLALSALGHRIGALRFLGVFVGFGPFVVAGVLHRLATGIRPERRRVWLDRSITLWCAGVVLAVVAVWQLNASSEPGGSFAVGRHVHAVAPAWSMAISALQFAVALGGWLLAAFFTRHWLAYLDRRDDASATAGSVTVPAS